MLIPIFQIISGSASINHQGSRQKSKHSINAKIHNKFSDVFSGAGCFESTFSLHIKDGSQAYQGLPRRVVYVLQETQGGVGQTAKAADNSTPGHGLGSDVIALSWFQKLMVNYVCAWTWLVLTKC